MRGFYFYLSLLLLNYQAFAQFTPPASTTLGTLSLTFSVGVNNAGSVVYNPIQQLYYISRCGNSNFPLETLSATGVPIFQSNTGMDTRGVWWNPNTLQVERNLSSNLGWGVINLDVNGNAISTNTTFFTGQLQPHVQSVGAYNYNQNEVLFYNGGSTIFRYDRNTGTQLASLTLTGATFTNTNTNSLIYTGQLGFEIGLLDVIAKKVLFFNIATGAFSAETLLPASAVTSSTFRFSYANGKVWLLNQPTATWESFFIFPDPPLPVSLSLFTASYLPHENQVSIDWITESEFNCKHFELEKSTNGSDFFGLVQVESKGNSSSQQTYQYIDKDIQAPYYYYRLNQVDIDGQYAHTEAVKVYSNNMTNVVLFTFADALQIAIPNIQGHCTLSLQDMQGRKVKEIQATIIGNWEETIDISQLAAGCYFYSVNRDGSIKTGKIMKN